jgi:hypothetical protein
MEDTPSNTILSPDVVITRRTGLATILVTVARKGEELNTLFLRYIPLKGKIHEGEHNPEEVCNLALRFLANSFGWYEEPNERRIELHDFESTDKAGQKTKYQAHVWVITIKKHGALIKR